MRIVLTGVALVLIAVSPASALDLDEVTCACADGALSRGDYQSCLATLTARLVDNGELTAKARSRLLRRGGPNVPQPGPDCGGPDTSDLAPLVFGFAVDADRPFYLPGDAIAARLLLWNETLEDARLPFSSVGPRGCWWDLRLRDGAGVLVHQVISDCAAALGELVVPAGGAFTVTADVPLATLASATGEADGTPLPPGVYWLEAVLFSGPLPAYPTARIPIRIE